MKRILVIEDNSSSMYLMQFLLRAQGYRVLEASDGLAGIQIACRELPDLIVLDIQLPEIDGYEVARRLKTYPETAAIPIVAVTSYAMVGDRERAMEAGCLGYLEKPIDPNSFVGQIERFLI